MRRASRLDTSLHNAPFNAFLEAQQRHENSNDQNDKPTTMPHTLENYRPLLTVAASAINAHIALIEDEINDNHCEDTARELSESEIGRQIEVDTMLGLLRKHVASKFTEMIRIVDEK